MTTTKAHLDLTSKFRPSHYMFGAMLGRMGEIEVGMPGGCKLGARPIDQHIKGFEALGANVTVAKGTIYAKKVVVACHYPFFIIPNLIPLKTYIKREYVNVGKVDKGKDYTAINIDNNL